MRQLPYDLLLIIFSIASVASAITVGIVLWLGRRIGKPIGNLEQAARALAEGNQTHPLPLERSDELGALARSFDDMRQRLAQQFNELRLATQAAEAAAEAKSSFS